MKVLHVITGLTLGGAETSLARLLPGLKSQGIGGEVVSLTGDDPIGATLMADGFRVDALRARASLPDPRIISRLASIIRERQPDLIQTWMYHANLAGALAGRMRATPVIWGIHHTVLGFRDLRPSTYVVAKLAALLSHSVPARIICCAESSLASHAAMGYDQGKMRVIPNGFDLQAYHPDAAARAQVRAELGLAADTPLVGLAARFDPQKDHATFMQAAGLLSQWMPSAHYLLWGRNIDSENRLLLGQIREQALDGHVHLLGPRHDSPRLFAALDVATLSSAFGEAFPLVVGEAMACGVPCAVTDVGDAAVIVGDTGRVVPTHQPEALAVAWLGLLTLAPDQRGVLGLKARKRIADSFSLARMAEAYARVYRDIIGSAGAP